MYTDGIGGDAMLILCLCWYSCVERTYVKVAEVLRNTELVVTRCISAPNFKSRGQARKLYRAFLNKPRLRRWGKIRGIEPRSWRALYLPTTFEIYAFSCPWNQDRNTLDSDDDRNAIELQPAKFGSPDVSLHGTPFRFLWPSVSQSIPSPLQNNTFSAPVFGEVSVEL